MKRVLVPGGDTTACLPIIESLFKKGIEVTVCSHKRMSVGFFSRYTTNRHLYPSPKEQPTEFINRMLQLVKENHYDMVMPVGEFVVTPLSKYKDDFLPFTKIFLPDYETFLKARDKSKTMKIAMENGIPHPKTYFPEEDDINQIRESVEYPVLVKPCVSYGAIGISIVNSKEALVATYNKVRSDYGDCIIQEYIPQTGMQYKAELIVDAQGEVKAGIVYAKIRYYPPTGGSSTLDCTVDRKDILETAKKMVHATGWYGIADLDFIEDPRDNLLPKLMEINPRYTRTIKIASIADLDFPYIAYQVAMGENPPPCTSYKIPMYLRFLPEDILWFLASSERFKAKPSFFKFFGKDVRGELFSLRDPAPTLAFLIDGFLMLLNKEERGNILRLKKKMF